MKLEAREVGSEARPVHRRSWGHYVTLYEHPGIKVKVLTIRPGCHIPLQYHKYHEEVWAILEGEGKATLEHPETGELCEIQLEPGDVVDVPMGRKHLIADNGSGLTFLETQIGLIVPGGDAELLEPTSSSQRITEVVEIGKEGKVVGTTYRLADS